MKKQYCCFCGWEVDTANNPAPLKRKGVCCSSCNARIVIPARLGKPLYVCKEDLYDDDLFVGVINTIEGWRYEAIKWVSDRADKVEELKSLPQEQVIDYVEDLGQIVLELYKYERC